MILLLFVIKFIIGGWMMGCLRDDFVDFFVLIFFFFDRIKLCKSVLLIRIDDIWCWYCYLCLKVCCVFVMLMCVYNGLVLWKSFVICSRLGVIKKVVFCKFVKMDIYM